MPSRRCCRGHTRCRASRLRRRQSRVHLILAPLLQFRWSGSVDGLHQKPSEWSHVGNAVLAFGSKPDRGGVTRPPTLTFATPDLNPTAPTERYAFGAAVPPYSQEHGTSLIKTWLDCINHSPKAVQPGPGCQRLQRVQFRVETRQVKTVAGARQRSKIANPPFQTRPRRQRNALK